MTGLTRLIKICALSAVCCLGALLFFAGERAGAYSGGPPTASTGAPNETTCVVCHNEFTLNAGGGAIAITGLPASYAPGQQVDVTVTVSFSARTRFGFQLTALDDSGKQAGAFTITDTARTQVVNDNVNGSPRSYVEHGGGGTTVPAPGGQNSWTFRWTAPATSVGKVTFYAAGNAANSNFQTTGDYIYTTSAVVQAPLPAFTTVSAAHFRSEPVAAEGFVTGFGQDFAVAPGVSATSLPLPTELAGVKVMVKDSAGAERAAGLFFVGPTQINYLMPAETANGTATVTVLKSNQTFSSGSVAVTAVAPGVFTANFQGTGVAAAIVQRVRGDGSQSFEPVARFDAGTSRWVGIPIDLGPATDKVYVQFYGTGWKKVGTTPVTAKVGGADAEVQYAGPQGDFLGLDQANVLIPRGQAGKGEVEVVLTFGDKTANTVTVTVQ
jgi:uncharacterized protein (TIGR03437 family)